MDKDDQYWMQQALEQAQKAADLGEVPVGAVLVQNNQMIGTGFNQPISSCDPSAHAEILALRAAAKALGNYRLPETTLYVTLEPCSMCAGALVHARVKRLVYAAPEPKAGVVASQSRFFQQKFLNHRLEVSAGVCREESAALLKGFFASRRALKKSRTKHLSQNPDAGLY